MAAAGDDTHGHHKPLASGAVLLAATTFGHLANFLFQGIMGRMLGGERFGEYGVLNAMLGILGLFAIPATALQLAIARQTALFDAERDANSVAALLQRAARRLAMGCGGLVVLMVALAPWLKSYLHLEHYSPILVTGGAIVVTVILPVVSGALQGLKRFGWMSVSGVLTPLVRIGAGVLLVGLGWKASGALFGTLAGNAAALVLGAVVLRGYWSRPVAYRDMDTSGVYRYLGPTLLSLIAYAGLVNLDLVMVKHYFNPTEAAQYSAATLFGRAVGWLIMPLCTVLFPHVTDERRARSNRALLLKFLLAASALGVAAALISSLASGLLTLLLLGRADQTVSALIRICVWAMLPLGVANVFLNFVMARGRYGFLVAFLVLVVLYVTAFTRWHGSLQQVLIVVAVFGVATLALFCLIVYGNPRNPS